MSRRALVRVAPVIGLLASCESAPLTEPPPPAPLPLPPPAPTTPTVREPCDAITVLAGLDGYRVTTSSGVRCKDRSAAWVEAELRALRNARRTDCRVIFRLAGVDAVPFAAVRTVVDGLRQTRVQPLDLMVLVEPTAEPGGDDVWPRHCHRDGARGEVPVLVMPASDRPPPSIIVGPQLIVIDGDGAHVELRSPRGGTGPIPELVAALRGLAARPRLALFSPMPVARMPLVNRVIASAERAGITLVAP